MMVRLARHISWLLFAGLLAGLAVSLVAFAVHGWLLLAYPHPLDYGEGPLLTQATLIQSGTLPWHIYSDPGTPPYSVVNYPPLYPLLTALAGWPVGDVVLAGRLLSLLAAAGCVAAIVLLATVALPGTGSNPKNREQPDREHQKARKDRIVRVLPFALLFLTIPIVYEWAALMRVDMMGVCLGLWGLVALRSRRPVVAGVLLLLSLYTKHSLIAAPASALLWAAWGWLRSHSQAMDGFPFRRSLVIVLVLLGVGGGVIFAFFQWASGGWFVHHVITANANRWDGTLAQHFWLEQVRLRWPLAVAALAGAGGLLITGHSRSPRSPAGPSPVLLPLLYTAGGAVVAVGVGKVGAYANYFLECYAGLVWLVCVVVDRWPPSQSIPPRGGGQVGGLNDYAFLKTNRYHHKNTENTKRLFFRLFSPGLFLLLLLSSLSYYPPVWSKTTLLPAGLVEKNPPRLAWGRYALWHDLARELAVLRARHQVRTVLIPQVRAAGEEIVTDAPGIAAEAGVRSRMQVFEHRQLLDQAAWDATPLLLDLANGQIPLAVIEYLGNWIPPAAITMLEHRYAQDGSLGIYDLYRPVAPGPRIAANISFAIGRFPMYLTAYHLGQPAGSWSALPNASSPMRYEAGEIVPITLEWERGDLAYPDTGETLALPDTLPTVVVQLTDEAGRTLAEAEQPLFYETLALETLPPHTPVQHMHLLRLPPVLPPARYGLALTLRVEGQPLTQPHPFATIVVGTGQEGQEGQEGQTAPLSGGRFFEETGYYVPAPFLQKWERIGGARRAGPPLSPAVPFAWGGLQCFAYTCLELRRGEVVQRPLGEQAYLAETQRSDACLDPPDPQTSPTGPRSPTVCPAFLPLWQSLGGEATLGPPISGEIVRHGHIVQWTRNARLERLPDGSYMGLGRLGAETLRLPPGVRYRWPGE
jgi:hypothetical protein